MDLSVREVARLLGVTEKTIHAWLREKAIPAHRLHDQFRFNRVEIQEWAAVRGLRLSPEGLGPKGDPDPHSSVRRAVERGGIYADVPGETPRQVLEAVTRLPGIPEGVDRSRLCELLVGREALTSTGIGGGIAIPHPRDPLVMRVPEPIILVSFLEHPVDFRAVDGAPVRVLFTILSPSVRAHLQLLSTLSYALHDTALLALLQGPSTPEALLKRIGEIESQERTLRP